VAQSCELFQRTFGELDVIHEEQLTGATLDRYDLLVLCDIELLPGAAARAVAGFVRGGGVVVADNLPVLGRLRRPSRLMEPLFGVNVAAPENAAGENREEALSAGLIRGRVFGREIALTVAGLRPCRPAGGTVLLRATTGTPALVRKRTGKGAAYLLGFCLKETYFRTWKEDDAAGRAALRALLVGMIAEAGVFPRVHSANPDIEAAIRTNTDEAFLFVISHEAADGTTRVTLRDLPFAIGRIMDVATGAALPFDRRGDAVMVRVTVDPDTRTRLLHLLPAE
jgi:hypothetical protein